MFGKKSSVKKHPQLKKAQLRSLLLKKLQLKGQGLFQKFKHKDLQNIPDKNGLQNLSFSILPMKPAIIK